MTDEAAVRDQMRKILESAGFRNSERLCRFLRYTVEAKLRGEDGQIKEYLLGREVFDRADAYDPRLDPIVRIEARRLRQKLADFYISSPVEPGGLRIDFPKGSYAPEFRRVEAAESPVSRRARDGRSVAAIAAVALLAALATGGYFWFRGTPSSGMMLAVVPARWTWTQDSFPATAYDEDIAEMTAAELANSHRARVVAWPSLQKYKGGGWNLRQIADDSRADRVLTIAVRVEADGLRVTAYLMDPKANQKMGVFDAPSQPLTTLEERRKAARVVAASVAERTK